MVRNIPYLLDPTILLQETAVPTIHEFARITSKGQITLPKAIRQALGVTTGEKVAFELRNGEVLVTRAGAKHADPAIGAFLGLLEEDIRNGRHVRALPDKLARAMLENAGLCDDLDEPIEGDVSL